MDNSFPQQIESRTLNYVSLLLLVSRPCCALHTVLDVITDQATKICEKSISRVIMSASIIHERVHKLGTPLLMRQMRLS